MAVLRDFKELYQISRSAPVSPSLFPKSRLHSEEQRFLSNEPKGGQLFRTYTSAKQMGVSQRMPRDFPRYPRLPAIGTIHEQESNKPTLTRQRTYTVLDPVYVKGPKEPIETPLKTPLVEPVKDLKMPFHKRKCLLPFRKKSSMHKKVQRRFDNTKQIEQSFSTIINVDGFHVSKELIETTKKLQADEFHMSKELIEATKKHETDEPLRSFWVQL